MVENHRRSKEIIEGGHSTGADWKEQATSAALEFTYLTRKLMAQAFSSRLDVLASDY